MDNKRVNLDDNNKTKFIPIWFNACIFWGERGDYSIKIGIYIRKSNPYNRTGIYLYRRFERYPAMTTPLKIGKDFDFNYPRFYGIKLPFLNKK